MIKAAIAATLDGVETEDIGDTTCTDARRRLSGASDAAHRRLEEGGGGAVIDFEITVTAETLTTISGSDDDGGAFDASSVIFTALEEAVNTGELVQNIAAEAVASGNTAMQTVEVSSISATASESYEVVYGIGCDEYHHMDYGQFGDVWLDGSVSLEACAAAVKSYSACDDPEYFFYEWNGYCNCPTADASCSSGENQNAGGERRQSAARRAAANAQRFEHAAASSQPPQAKGSCTSSSTRPRLATSSPSPTNTVKSTLICIGRSSRLTLQYFMTMIHTNYPLRRLLLRWVNTTIRPRRAPRPRALRTGSGAAAPSTFSGASKGAATARGKTTALLRMRIGTRARASCTSSRTASSRRSPTAARTGAPAPTAVVGTTAGLGARARSAGARRAARARRARVTPNTMVEYTCCMSGDNVGEECGDCCVDYESILIAIIGGVVGGVVFLICCAIAICYVAKCACFAKNVASVAVAPPVATIEMATPMQPMVALQPQNAKSNSITLQAQPQAAVVLQPHMQPQGWRRRCCSSAQGRGAAAGAADAARMQPQVLTPQVMQPQVLTPTPVQSL